MLIFAFVTLVTLLTLFVSTLLLSLFHFPFIYFFLFLTTKLWSHTLLYSKLLLLVYLCATLLIFIASKPSLHFSLRILSSTIPPSFMNLMLLLKLLFDRLGLFHNHLGWPSLLLHLRTDLIFTTIFSTIPLSTAVFNIPLVFHAIMLLQQYSYLRLHVYQAKLS